MESKFYSQNCPLWKDLKIGKSNTSIGSNGCYIASICNARRKFYDEDYTPAKAAREWIFVKQGTDPEPHWLSYETQFPGFRIRRVRGFDKEDLRNIKELIKDKDTAVCIEVETKTGGRHWLYVDRGYVLGGLKCVDPFPYPADRGTRMWGFMGRYKRPVGYSVLYRMA